ncbi:hypothetical protein AMTRI_Chr06g171950 [Amborella trichopoda]
MKEGVSEKRGREVSDGKRGVRKRCFPSHKMGKSLWRFAPPCQSTGFCRQKKQFSHCYICMAVRSRGDRKTGCHGHFKRMSTHKKISDARSDPRGRLLQI